ncbi:hypothetical protein LP419_17980 [Massilia sp. H-1]|nr:hypothetical protein LP419_17980 [Massilia sp. H-1]
MRAACACRATFRPAWRARSARRGLRRDQPHQPGDAQFPGHADHRDAHAGALHPASTERVASLDFNAPVVKNFIARLKKKGTVIDSTLATFAFLKQKDGDMNTPFAPIAAHMPPDVQRGFHVGSMKIADAAAQARYEKSYAKMVEFVGLLYKAGVPLVAGTDEMA